MSGRSPGARCQWILQRCLAIHLTRCDPRRVVQPPPPPDPPPSQLPSSPPQHYWMYDSGYLIFQGFLEANLKCFWNPGLMDAVRQLEFQGWVAPGVLLVTANPCALEVVRAAWARNVLKSPPSYSLALVGDVEDCLIQPISQGQFTPLPEALCWVILEITSMGQSAVIETIKNTLNQVFPDIQRPSHDLIYDTLAQLSAERKLYQTSAGYFVMTPESRRLRSHSRSRSSGRSGGHESPRVTSRQPLMSTEEAVVFVHGEMETLRDGNLTHQAIQTNLADVICGGNPNDKVLYGRIPSGRRFGSGLERRHSLRLFGSNKRLATLHRSGSMRLLNSSRYVDHSDHANSDSTLVAPKKSLSLLSRLFRRSKRRLGGSRGAAPLSTFSAQFPPSEWFNSRVVHLHSVGTQTQLSRASPSFRQEKGDNWRACNDDRSSSSTLPHRHRRQSSSSGLSHPPSRRASPSPVSKTLTPSASSSKSVSPSRSSLSSSKTVVNNRCLSSPTAKSLSSSSSGYNSLPRSKSPARSQSRNSTPKGSPLHSVTPKLSPNKSSITVQVSTNQNTNSTCNGSIISNQIKSTLGSENSSTDDKNSTTMTTTINGPNSTKIFVQQQNSPVRSVITFENGTSKSNTGTKDIIVLNPGKPAEVKPVIETDFGSNKIYKKKLERPTSLYSNEDENNQKNDKIFGQLETQLKMKFPSSETIQLEEKLLASTKNNNKNNEQQQISKERSKNIALKAGSLMDMSNVNFGNELELNNVRKSSISSTQTLQSTNCKENLSFKNLLKDTMTTTSSSDRTLLPLILNKDDKNLCNSNPPSPTKSLSNVFINDSLSNYINSGGDNDKVTSIDKNEALGKLSESFPSLSDLSLHFTSIAAQNILKGVSINSIDTLVEVNMAAEKQNNCDVTIHTDFGCV